MSSSSEPIGRSLRPRSTAPSRPVAETFSAAGTGRDTGPRRTKTSLTLDVEIYRRAKIAAIQRGLTASEFIEAAIEEALSRA